MSHRPILLRLPLVGAIALLGGILLLGATDAPAEPADRNVATQSRDAESFRGTVTGWSLAADGNVRVRLLVGEAEGDQAMWFVTPPDLTRTTRFEHMLLSVLLDGGEGAGLGMSLHLVAERDQTHSGRSMEEALEIVSVSKLD